MSVEITKSELNQVIINNVRTLLKGKIKVLYDKNDIVIIRVKICRTNDPNAPKYELIKFIKGQFDIAHPCNYKALSVSVFSDGFIVLGDEYIEVLNSTFDNVRNVYTPDIKWLLSSENIISGVRKELDYKTIVIRSVTPLLEIEWESNIQSPDTDKPFKPVAIIPRHDTFEVYVRSVKQKNFIESNDYYTMFKANGEFTYNNPKVEPKVDPLIVVKDVPESCNPYA